jgi:DinB superfamily
MTANSTITALISDIQSVTDEAQTSFAHLSGEQLNWKQSLQQWSIGQCLDHLVTSNNTYFPTFEKVIRGEQRATLWERMPLLPGFFGKTLIKSLGPLSTRKLKAPQAFRPASSRVDGEIVNHFIAQQHRLTEYIKASGKPQLLETIISSPASGLVTYSLLDAYRIIVVHERRHMLQAQKVMAANGFPQQPSAS